MAHQAGRACPSTKNVSAQSTISPHKFAVAGTRGKPHPGHPPPMLSLEECLNQRQVCLRAGTLGEPTKLGRSLVDRQRRRIPPRRAPQTAAISPPPYALGMVARPRAVTTLTPATFRRWFRWDIFQNQRQCAATKGTPRRITPCGPLTAVLCSCSSPRISRNFTTLDCAPLDIRLLAMDNSVC